MKTKNLKKTYSFHFSALFFTFFLICFGFFLSKNSYAQDKKEKKEKKEKDKIVRVSSKVEILMEGDYTQNSMKEKAIQACKIQAMGDEFGYAIIQGINTQTKSVTGASVMTTSKLNEVSNTLVKGEWISDDAGYPKTKFSIRDKGDKQEIWLECEVRGKARKIQESKVSFETFTYNCQEPQKCNTGQFKHEESMYLYFKTATKGFLSVFMLEDGLVHRLLPYTQMQDTYESVVPVEADKEYLLFSPKHRDYFPDYPLVDEYEMQTQEDGSPVSNLVYVIFSTKPFAKPLLTEKDNFKVIDLPKFQEWLNKNQGLDKNLQVKRMSVTVNK